MSIEAIRELETLASVCQELNMANYTEDDVRHLNDWAIEMSLLAEKVAAIQQAEAQQPATGEPVLFIHPATFAMNNAHVGAWKPGHELTGDIPLYTHPEALMPDDVVRVPVQILKDASEALGNFVSDHGWGDADMQAMDNLDAYIARHEANRAAKEGTNGEIN